MGKRGILYAILLVFGIGITATQPMSAQGLNSPNGSILMINQERLFSTSLYGERIKTEIEEASAALAAENRKIEADLTAEEKSLTERRSELEPESFRLLADEFDKKVQGIRRAQDTKTRVLGQRMEEERLAYYNLALPVLGALMKERGAVAILDRRSVFISADDIDITDEAVRRIDATLGDGTVQPNTPEE